MGRDVDQVAGWLICATLLLACFMLLIAPGTADAQLSPFALRTEPGTPIAGEPFQVVATGNRCESLFIGNPYAEPESYDDVRVSGNLIRVRVGYYPEVICDVAPQTVRLTVPGLASGHYQLELVGRFLFTTNDNVIDRMGLFVAQPPRSVPVREARGLMVLSLAMLLAGAAAIRNGSG